MSHISIRRWLAGPATAVAVVLAGATPAFAAADPVVTVTLPAHTSVGVGSSSELDPALIADREVVVTGAALTYELAGDLPGVGLTGPEWGGDCTIESAVRITCRASELALGPEEGYDGLSATLAAGADAVAGSTGTIRATFSADGIEPVSTTAAVAVAEGVDLVANETPTVTIAPGTAFDGALVVTNASDVVVRGVAVVGTSDYAIEAVRQHSNCLYGDDGRFACLFPQNLQPGATYRAALPLRLRADAPAPATVSADLRWLTAAEFARTGHPGTRGPGGKLRLDGAAGSALTPATRTAQTDVDPGNNFESISARSTGVQGVDIVALGAEVSGAAGETVTATVGVRNDGPATLDRNRVGEPATAAVLTVPTGTTVTTVPDGCDLIRGGNIGAGPDAVQYLCYTGEVHRAGETVSWSFGLRVDTVRPDATGAFVSNPACTCSFYTRDTDKSNDRALLVVNPS